MGRRMTMARAAGFRIPGGILIPGIPGTPYITLDRKRGFCSLAAIFEFGFSDAILQMWASFLYELKHGQRPARFAGCVTPEETALSHRLFTAALESQRTAATID
jgi:hypothetical protein